MSSNRWSVGSPQDKSASSFQPLSSPASSGWGKQAAKRFDTSEVFKKDPLLKSLQEKISVGFGDYKPWQRTSLPRNAIPTKPSTPKSVTRQSNRPLSSRQTRSSYSAGGTSKGGNEIDRPTSGITLHSQCSSVCFHPWMKKNAITPVYTVDKRKLKFLSVLRSQIKSRQRTIQEYKKRRVQLLQDNLAFKEHIESSEVQVHDKVKGLLQKYDKFRGALDTLHKTYEDDLIVAKKSLRSTQIKVDMQIEELQQELNALNAKLQKELDKTHVLLNYKDKEYPEKALQIARLKKRKEIIAASFKEELEELQAVIEAETIKFGEHTFTTHEEVKVKAVESVMKCVSKGVQDMALQNMIMKKEIEIHTEKVKQLEEKNKQLEDKIQKLLKSRELNTKAQLFPDVCGERLKCTPDMDVVLDIPTHKWLPI